MRAAGTVGSSGNGGGGGGSSGGDNDGSAPSGGANSSSRPPPSFQATLHNDGTRAAAATASGGGGTPSKRPPSKQGKRINPPCPCCTFEFEVILDYDAGPLLGGSNTPSRKRPREAAAAAAAVVPPLPALEPEAAGAAAAAATSPQVPVVPEMAAGSSPPAAAVVPPMPSLEVPDPKRARSCGEVAAMPSPPAMPTDVDVDELMDGDDDDWYQPTIVREVCEDDYVPHAVTSGALSMQPTRPPPTPSLTAPRPPPPPQPQAKAKAPPPPPPRPSAAAAVRMPPPIEVALGPRVVPAVPASQQVGILASVPPPPQQPQQQQPQQPQQPAAQKGEKKTREGRRARHKRRAEEAQAAAAGKGKGGAPAAPSKHDPSVANVEGYADPNMGRLVQARIEKEFETGSDVAGFVRRVESRGREVRARCVSSDGKAAWYVDLEAKADMAALFAFCAANGVGCTRSWRCTTIPALRFSFDPPVEDEKEAAAMVAARPGHGGVSAEEQEVEFTLPSEAVLFYVHNNLAVLKAPSGASHTLHLSILDENEPL